MGWSDGRGAEIGIVLVRWERWGNRGFGDCLMHTFCLPSPFFDLFAEVKRQTGFLAVALTLGNQHTRVFMIFVIWCSRGIPGSREKKNPLHLPWRKPFRAAKHFEKNKLDQTSLPSTRSYGTLRPESLGGTTSTVSNEFSTFWPLSVWYPPPAGDRPSRSNLRVLIITNTWLLQRQVKRITENKFKLEKRPRHVEMLKEKYEVRKFDQIWWKK